jgi:multidrug efflux pump subunit AcrB
VDGQRSVYAPALKQGGDTNTIAVVNGIKGSVADLVDVPRNLVTRMVFGQSQFVRTAIETLLHEGAIGLFLTPVVLSAHGRRAVRHQPESAVGHASQG